VVEPGDSIVDCGNAHFADTRRREKALAERGIHFVGAGVSGGEEGALEARALCPAAGRVLQNTRPDAGNHCAQGRRHPCCVHVGPMAPAICEMVHNGIGRVFCRTRPGRRA